jgi:hypothetical protein
MSSLILATLTLSHSCQLSRCCVAVAGYRSFVAVAIRCVGKTTILMIWSYTTNDSIKCKSKIVVHVDRCVLDSMVPCCSSSWIRSPVGKVLSSYWRLDYLVIVVYTENCTVRHKTQTTSFCWLHHPRPCSSS